MRNKHNKSTIKEERRRESDLFFFMLYHRLDRKKGSRGGEREVDK